MEAASSVLQLLPDIPPYVQVSSYGRVHICTTNDLPCFLASII